MKMAGRHNMVYNGVPWTYASWGLTQYFIGRG